MGGGLARLLGESHGFWEAEAGTGLGTSCVEGISAAGGCQAPVSGSIFGGGLRDIVAPRWPEPDCQVPPGSWKIMVEREKVAVEIGPAPDVTILPPLLVEEGPMTSIPVICRPRLVRSKCWMRKYFSPAHSKRVFPGAAGQGWAHGPRGRRDKGTKAPSRRPVMGRSPAKRLTRYRRLALSFSRTALPGQSLSSASSFSGVAVVPSWSCISFASGST